MSTRTTAMTVRAADSEFTCQPLEIDAPRADEVRLRVEAVGMCHATATPVSPGQDRARDHRGVGMLTSRGRAFFVTPC